MFRARKQSTRGPRALRDGQRLWSGPGLPERGLLSAALHDQQRLQPA